MMPFGKLKEYIGAKIDTATTIDVYGTEAVFADDEEVEYLVYKFPSGNNNDSLVIEKWILEIDYWKKSFESNDSTTILAAAEAVKTALNGRWQVEIEGFYKCYIDFASEIPTGEDGVYHFHQRYVITLF